MRKKEKRMKNWKPSLVLAILLTLLFAGSDISAAEDPYDIEISSFEQLMDYVQMSKSENFVEPKQWTLRLTNDIVLTEQNKADIRNGVYDLSTGEEIRSVTFGNKNKKFSGVFDGQGHKIVGLEYDEEIGYLSDTGLFSYTDGAVIKNLVIENANIDADYRGGFIVGSADNTTLENITVKDSYMRVSCSNNVLTLVTDGGLSGGAIAGEAVNCVLYNCESNNSVINNNNTAGVQALGGKGLYLGGLVGTADKETLIEYSRVIGGEVKSYYDVAVGALGGNTLYVGGIVGELQAGSKVMDCFATPYLYFYTATYVSVGAGNTGRIGGIAAAAYGNNCEIERCHFAGTAESKQYNAILVIPIIEKNKNIYGLVDNIPDEVTVKECYVKESNLPDAKAIRDNKVKDGSTGYGMKDDATYGNITFWKDNGFDFDGNIPRETKFTKVHENKWAMDYEQGIPVHEPSLTVRYHDLDGNTIYSVNTHVYDKRTFVDKEVPIDSKAFSKIEETLEANQTFVEWQWWDETKEQFVPWDKFKNIEISKPMEIYPIVYQVEFFDAKDTAVNYVDIMAYELFEEGKEYTLNVIIDQLYSQEYLDIYITKLSYEVVNGIPTVLGGVKDIETNVYVKKSTGDSGEEEDEPTGPGMLTDENGKARHYFYGYLKIEKTYVDAKNKETNDESVNGCIVVDLMKKLDDGSYETLSMPIKMVSGRGEVDLKLPVGKYFVVEDSWSWRDKLYTAKLRDDMADTESVVAPDTEIELNILDNKVLEISNIQTEKRWFSGSCRKQNVFSKVNDPLGGE